MLPVIKWLYDQLCFIIWWYACLLLLHLVSVCYEELKKFDNTLVLKDEQKSMIKALCSGKDGYCVQPTGRDSNAIMYNQ